MAQSSTDNILSLVNVAGSQEKYAAYCNAVKKTLPNVFSDKDRYMRMYLQIAQGLLSNQYVKNKSSILTCMFNAVKLGLNPDPVFGEIYFIPYSGEVTYQIGYKGMIELSRRTGTVSDVAMYQVFAKDEFDFYEDEKGQHFKYRPSIDKERGSEICCISIVSFKDGTRSAHYMESERINNIKKIVLARTPKSPWANELYESEMRKKTCLRRHWKTLPKSSEISHALEYEESIERGEILKQKHPEIEGIIEELVEKSQQPEAEEGSPLSVFDEPRTTV